ncbi:MAG TPA: toxin-antitoxin system HicB family antitoxin [Thermoanaerobaculia bacterium]|nr:toxin-antitoxin system HicB family antitoxin [Thermoanaerobaculia bacterium]
MARLSLRLPDTLRDRLNLQARHEGVSLNQFLLFLLAERSRPTYTLVPADKTVQEQHAAFDRLRERLGSASEDEIWKILDQREPVPSESDIGWTPELRNALEARIEAARKAASGS